MRELTVKDLIAGIAGASIFLLVMPDPGDLTKYDVIVAFIGMITITVMLKHWLMNQIEYVKMKREKLRISKRQKVVDVKLRRTVHIPARRVFENE